MATRKRYDGEYVRGGQSTLYLSRSDVVEALALILRGRFDLRAMLAEARAINREIAAAKREERAQDYR